MNGNDMRLGPDDLMGREFTIGLRGYDQGEVDAFLAHASEAWRASLAAPPAGGLSPSAIAALAGPTDDRPEDSDTPPEAALAPCSVAPDPDAVSAQVLTGSPTAAAQPPDPASRALVERWRAEADADRTTAFAERKAAEFDRASARTELARAQESALQIIDQAQRRAEAVLTSARERAQAEAGSVLEDARSRLMPLLETERAARSRLTRLRLDLDGIAEVTTETWSLPDADELVTAAEDDPEAPEVSFPVGFGLVTVPPAPGA